MTTDARAKFEALPRKLLDVACRIRAGETLFRDDELVDEAAHALKAALASAQAASAEPVAHICVLPTKDAGPTKFFTSPSDPRGFPVYTAPATAAKPAAVTDELLPSMGTALLMEAAAYLHPDLPIAKAIADYLATRTPEPQAAFCDPTDPGHDVNVLREHVRHLERRVRQLSEPQPDSRNQEADATVERLMLLIRRWHLLVVDWNRPYNRDMQEPVTEAQIDDAAGAIVEALRAALAVGQQP